MVTRRIGRQRRNWTDAHKAVLIYGRDFFAPGWPWAGGVDCRRRYPECVIPASEIPAAILADMRAAWEVFRDEIMGEWSEPDRRPWAWWLFDAPESRDNDIPEAAQLRRMGF